MSATLSAIIATGGLHLPRGGHWIRPGEADQVHEDGTMTFVVEEPRFSATYHRFSIIGKTDYDELIVDVRADTVVTWERRA